MDMFIPKFIPAKEGKLKLYEAWHDRFTRSVVFQGRDREAAKGRYEPAGVKKWPKAGTYYLVLPYTVAVAEEGTGERLDIRSTSRMHKFKVAHVVGKLYTGHFVLKLARGANLATLSPRTGFLIVRGAEKEALLKKWAAHDAKKATETKPEEEKK